MGLACGGQRAQQVMDECEAEQHRRKEADERHVGRKSEQHAEEVQRPAARAKEAPHLGGGGMLGERGGKSQNGTLSKPNASMPAKATRPFQPLPAMPPPRRRSSCGYER